jgi:hypothetical protein
LPIEDLVTVNVTTTGAGVTRDGYGVGHILSHDPPFNERSRTYSNISAVGDDFEVNTPEYMAAQAYFAQTPHPSSLVIGRAVNKPTQSYTIGVQGTPAVNTPYKVRVAVPTGVVFPSQNATYNPGAGATPWSPSAIWIPGDLIIGSDGTNMWSCLGRTGIAVGFTAFGGASGPTGTSGQFLENQTAWLHVGSGITGGVSNDAIMNGLKSAIVRLSAPTCVASGVATLITATLAGSAGSKTLALTASTPARFFAVQVYNRNNLTCVQDHADPGVAADLTAIKNENNSWYGLITLFNSEALIEAAQSWVETNKKLYPAASVDTTIARVAETGSATDVAHDTKASAYARSWVFFHPSPDEFADAAEMGKFFPISPGGETWRMKTLSGVTVETFTDTEITNMRAKYAHYYYSVGGKNVVGGDAKMGANDYVDVTRFVDWYTSELQAKLANLLLQNNKIPFTNAGIDMVVAQVAAQNVAGIKAGGIAEGTDIITAPDISEISVADKQSRELGGVVTEWTLAGAIHHITVSVTASA